MDSFWQKLPKPFFALAPMADVTDAAYRRLIGETAKPDVMWTEFVSADGLYHTREKRNKDGYIIYDTDEENPLVRDLQFSEGERPILAQFFTSNPEMMEYAAHYAADRGFDGIDINMGCPDRSIEKQKAGAALIKDPARARELIRTARVSHLPVSVKTRIGYNTETLDEWLPEILKEKPDALTVHLRTRKEMSSVPAHWELMERVIALRDHVSPSTLVIGNGDVRSLDEAREKARVTGADGIMLGRAIFGNPWLFSSRAYTDISISERLAAFKILATYFDELRPRKSFHILKKHIKAFVHGWEGAARFRGRLMEATTQDELLAILGEHDIIGDR